MGVKLSEHVRFQIRVRKISTAKVIDTVKNPDRKIKSFKNRVLRQKQINDKILEVVTITEGSRITVVTVYYLEGKNEN